MLPTAYTLKFSRFNVQRDAIHILQSIKNISVYPPLIFHSFYCNSSLSGRGFDSESFAEKDESAICHYNVDGMENPVAGRKPLWDLDHPSMPHPRSNCAVFLLGV